MPANYLSLLPSFPFICFNSNDSKGLSSSPFPLWQRERFHCHKHQLQVLTLSCPSQTALDAAANLLIWHVRRGKPDLVLNTTTTSCYGSGHAPSLVQALLEGANASALALACVPLVSEHGGCCTAMGSVGPAHRGDGGASHRAVRAAWAGVQCRHGGCCIGDKAESSWGPILVTSFLQRILENSNKIRNKLRCAAGLSCETCLP